ncbi:hypothetical protein AVEN_50916-1 [Araneus ventricosus]|uniref:Uncharacterized protein n=1 Tax=Araneus ventricosus TaxID=182803 RepID=A0A4Y2DXW2_ARAVE|nr:hypothetical protein AVEN_50916-1 [Araneus ventricosus]
MKGSPSYRSKNSILLFAPLYDEFLETAELLEHYLKTAQSRYKIYNRLWEWIHEPYLSLLSVDPQAFHAPALTEISRERPSNPESSRALTSLYVATERCMENLDQTFQATRSSLLCGFLLYYHFSVFRITDVHFTLRSICILTKNCFRFLVISFSNIK